MAQEAEAAPQGQEPEAQTEDNSVREAESKTFDAEYVKQLRSENARWRIEAQQAKEKAEEYEEANKSELEKAQGKATKADQRAAQAEARLLRFEVAAEKQLPKALVARLRGDTREELEADADELLELVKARNDQDTPDFDGGAREPAPDPDPDKAHNEIALALLGLKQ